MSLNYIYVLKIVGYLWLEKVKGIELRNKKKNLG